MESYPERLTGMYTAAYGVVGYHSNVDSNVYDAHQAYEIDKTKMKMLVPLDMNNQRILNSPDIIPSILISKKQKLTNIYDGGETSRIVHDPLVIFNHSVLIFKIIYKSNIDIKDEKFIFWGTWNNGSNISLKHDKNLDVKANKFYVEDANLYFERRLNDYSIATFKKNYLIDMIMIGVRL